MKKYKSPDIQDSVLNDPLVAYGSANYFAMANSFITKNYIKQVLTLSRLNLLELMEVVPMSIDTYKRKSSFNPSVTEKILEIEEVYRKGLAAFGDGFYKWMNIENVALGGLIPKDLLKNSFGIRRLLDQIGRMQHGVLA